MSREIVAVGQYDKKIKAVTHVFGFFDDRKSAEAFMTESPAYSCDANGRYCFGVFSGVTNFIDPKALDPELLIPQGKSILNLKLITPGPWINTPKSKSESRLIWYVAAPERGMNQWDCFDAMIRTCNEHKLNVIRHRPLNRGWQFEIEDISDIDPDIFNKFSYKEYQTVSVLGVD